MIILSMVLFIGLLYLLQRKIYARFWDRGLGMRISFSAREAFEGDRLVLIEELANEKLLPLPWITAKFQLSRNLLFPEGSSFRVSDDYYQSDMFSVAMYQRITRRQAFICGRRGFYRIKSMDLTSSNLLITDKLVRRLSCSAELTVFPKLIPTPELEMVYRQIYGDIEVRRFTNPDPFTFRGIREYQQTDDFRLINFKATAKTGRLMVNVSGATASQELVILLNLQPYSDFPNEDVFEESIRLAASAAEHFSALGLAVGLYSNGRDAVTASPVRILPGSGNRHFRGILEKLARIDLALEREPMRGWMDGIREAEPVYLLISPYDGEDLSGAFWDMLERGLKARWILPAQPDAKLHVEESPAITIWEVTPYDAPTNFYKKAAV